MNYFKNKVAETKQHRCINISKYGRKLYLTNQDEGEILRLSMNAPIQGEAADMSKRAGNYIRREWYKNQEKFDIIILWHDEWVLELKDSKYEQEVKDILRQSMIKAGKILIKDFDIKVEIKFNTKLKK